jgi:hypothetical protein
MRGYSAQLIVNAKAAMEKEKGLRLAHFHGPSVHAQLATTVESYLE